MERDIAAFRARRAERERLMAAPKVEILKIKEEGLTAAANTTPAKMINGGSEQGDLVMGEESTSVVLDGPVQTNLGGAVQSPITQLVGSNLNIKHDLSPKALEAAQPTFDMEPQQSDLQMTAVGAESKSNTATANPAPPEELTELPTAVAIEDTNFESMFTDEGMGTEANIDLEDFDFPAGSEINQNYVDSGAFELLDAPPTDTTAKATSNEDINSLLPGLDQFAEGDFSMIDLAPTASMQNNSSVYVQPASAVSVSIAPQPISNAPYDTTFDDMFASGNFSASAGGDAEMGNYENMGDFGDFDDDAWFNMAGS